MKALALRWIERPWAAAVQARYGVQLLLDRRLALFLTVDVMLLLYSILDILGAGAKPKDVFQGMVVFPLLLLGLPALAGVLDLERRAGSLDLALAVPSTERYFLRRAAPVCLFFVLQGTMVLSFGLDHSGDFWRAWVQSLVLVPLVVAVVMFWAVRLRTSGAVLAASVGTVAVLARWIFRDPTFERHVGIPEFLLGIPVPWLGWWWNLGVLTTATLLFFVYARQRLRRPEAMLF